jgi:hypothetical protein
LPWIFLDNYGVLVAETDSGTLLVMLFIQCVIHYDLFFISLLDVIVETDIRSFICNAKAEVFLCILSIGEAVT